MKRRDKVTTVLILLVVILLGCAFYLARGSQSTNTTSNKKNNKDLPTLYLHGIHGTGKDLNGLITVAKRNGGNGYLKVIISKNGTITYHGKLHSDDNQPLIQIEMANSEAPMNQQASWVNQILKHLHQKYNYRHYNTVGLSSGAVVFFIAASNNTKCKSMPQPKRMVTIAAPFNGILHMDDKPNANKIYSNGKPLIMREANPFYPGYRSLLSDAKKMPNGVGFLNIYGNLKNKTNSDGIVTTNSAESLKYLVSKKSNGYYQHLEVTGHDAAHRQLPNNQIVDREATRYLFDNY